MTDAAFWDRIADKYAKTPIRNTASYDYTTSRIRASLNPTDRVLELGCGTGSTALELAPGVGEIVATDISPAMLAKGREKAEAAQIGNVTFRTGDAASAPDGPFDAVLALNLLHLVPDLDAALAEIARRTRPGGLFISKTFCMPDRFGWMSLMVGVGLPVMQAIGKAPFLLKFSAGQLDRAVMRAGFTLIEAGQGPNKDPRRFLIARRDA